MNWKFPLLIPLNISLGTLLFLANNVRHLRAKLLAAGKFRLRPDDVFIVSFPKSGTTMMQMLLYQMTTDGSMDFPHIDAVSPWWEKERDWGNHRFLESTPSPRLFKSHLRYEQLPRGARYIYIARDIRGVAVSAFHHYCLVTGVDHDMEKFMHRFMRGRAFCGSWFRHIESWWPRRNDPGVLFLTYEAMVGDLQGTMLRVADFLGIGLEEERASRILERCSFDFMKQHGAKFDPRLNQTSRKENAFIRRGKPDGWKDEFSACHGDELRMKSGDLAKRLGCIPGEPFSELFFLGETRA